MGDPYKAGRNNIFGDKPKWVYTCNCGWLDMSHGTDTTQRQYIGATNLWDQIKNETGKRSGHADGFQVIYAQDARFKIFGYNLGNIGSFASYFVAFCQSDQQKEAIAMAIFREISLRFEAMQGFHPTSDSSFSQEDLISNIFGFYNVVRPGINSYDLCKPVSQKAAFEVYKRMIDEHKSMGGVKNKSFDNPVLYPCTECDDCQKQFPMELRSIIPATKENARVRHSTAKFRDWMPYDEISVRYLPRGRKIPNSSIHRKFKPHRK